MSLYNYTVLDNIKSPNITTVQCLLPTHYSSIQYVIITCTKHPLSALQNYSTGGVVKASVQYLCCMFVETIPQVLQYLQYRRCFN